MVFWLLIGYEIVLECALEVTWLGLAKNFLRFQRLQHILTWILEFIIVRLVSIRYHIQFVLTWIDLHMFRNPFSCLSTIFTGFTSIVKSSLISMGTCCLNRVGSTSAFEVMIYEIHYIS